jgi:hypothetical protein
MLSRVKRFAARLILIVPASVRMPAVSAAAALIIDVKDQDQADA